MAKWYQKVSNKYQKKTINTKKYPKNKKNTLLHPVTCVKLHSLKAPSPMLSTDSGICTSWDLLCKTRNERKNEEMITKKAPPKKGAKWKKNKNMQLKNTFKTTFKIPKNTFKSKKHRVSLKLRQPRKALSPMPVTELGIVTCCRPGICQKEGPQNPKTQNPKTQKPKALKLKRRPVLWGRHRRIVRGWRVKPPTSQCPMYVT